MNRTYNDEMFIDTFEHEYTWLNGFLRNVRRYGDRTAIIDPVGGRSLTYDQLNKEANRLANALKADGAGKNDVIMCVLKNCPEFGVCYVAPRKIGAIVMPANFNLARGELALLIDHNRPKAVIYSADVARMVCEAAELAHYKDMRLIMADNLKGTDVPEGHISYDEYIENAPESEPEKDFRPHIYDEVLRLHTSGTTAMPKCVPLNDINEVLSAHDVIMQYPLNVSDITINMTPWFHRGGCHCGGPGPSFYMGSAVICMRQFSPHQCLRWVSEYGATFLMGSPSCLEMLARTQERSPQDLSTLKGLVTMGAPLEKQACIRYMEVLTPNIFNGYGTTETFWNSFLRPYDLPEGAGGVGGSCIDDEVRVVNLYEDRKAEPGDMVPRDGKTEGEVIIWSPAKSTYSYYKNDEMEKEKFYKGWMYTGDTGTWNEKWHVTVKGRKDDMMVVAGENIYPTQVEEALNRHPGIRDCIATCVPDRVRGQAVVAYVIAEGDAPAVRELIEYCASCPDLSQYKCPKYYAFIDEIPMTATGKKQHNVIKARAEKDLADGKLLSK